MLFLRDIYEAKVARGDADASRFRTTVRGEFASGLNATAPGAANSLRCWIANRQAWVSDDLHASRIEALADIEATLNHVAKAA